MKKTWFHGLALSLGITTLPSVVNAQYNYPSTGGGLPPNSFQLPPLPAQQQYAPARAPATFVGYAQQGASIGSGAIDPYSVPLPPAGQLPTPVAPPQAAAHQHPTHPGQAQPYAAQPYELVAPNAAPQPIYSSPAAAAPHGSSSACPACATGNCTVHGGGQYQGGQYQDHSGYGVSPTYSTLGGYDSGNCSTGACYDPSPALSLASVSPTPWIFGAGALVFSRVDDSDVRLSYDSNMPTDPLLSTRDARMDTSGGFQGSIGRYFGCGRYALVATYWGIYTDEQSQVIMPPPGGNLRSSLPFTLRRPDDVGMPGMPYGITMPGQNVYDWYDMAAAHRIVRDSDFHNVELNLFSFALGGGARQGYPSCGTGGGGLGSRLGGGNNCDPCGTSCSTTGPTGPCAPWYGAQCSKLRLSTFGGVRWFRFRDNLEYATSETDTMFNGGADDFYYRNNVTNDLVGFQLGGMANWCTGTRVNLYSSTAFGIYNNRIQTDTFAGTSSEAATIMSSNSFNGRAYDYMNESNRVAFLGEGNVGMGVCLCKGWTANLGYRVVAVSGVASAVGQIPRDFSNGDEINRINNDRSLILHGAVFGVNYNF